MTDKLGARVSGVVSFFRYWINYTKAAPGDAYRAGEPYGIVIALLSGIIPGTLLFFVRLVIGPVVAGLKWKKNTA